jgi:competence protein ComEA
VDLHLEKFGGRRVLVAIVVLAAVGLMGGYGVAMRAKPKAAKIALASSGPRGSGNGVRSGRLVYVHVGGAVAHPGLYQLPDGSRVYDAVQAAGGATEQADLDSLNLASKVKDGDKVLVPARADPGADPGAPGAATAGGGGATSAGGLVNLHSATVEQLDSLPGIGPSTAQKIIDYRTQHGGFRSVDELMDVPGIGPAKFAELKDQVTV